MSEDLLPPGVPIDLDNCAREPIHLSGAVQPRGVLLVVRDLELVVLQATRNAESIVGRPAADCVGRDLEEVLGPRAAAAVGQAVRTFGDLRDRNPIELEIGGELCDVIINRADEGLLLIELEPANGPRPLSFPNTYQAVRSTVERLNRAATLAELFQVTADSVRALAGFDRVMVYRYDEEWNGEVVAEAKVPELNSFLGLHYPASDIPAQARALYEKNWIRLISDVSYTPSPLIPAINPVTGGAVDLTFSTLRSVSPIHIEYLSNMGVQASMSISLMRDGRLWGLIACHHHAGPHTPPYGIRAAAEFLGSTLSLRLLDRFDEDELRERIRTQTMLSDIVAVSRDSRSDLAAALASGPDLRELISAQSVVIRSGGTTATLGPAPAAEVVDAILEWARATFQEISSTDIVTEVVEHGQIGGAMAILLPDDDAIVWFRPEAITSVDWGGDPHNKELQASEDASVRLSPRKSFERWTEVVRGRCAPWTELDLELAFELRRHLVESLYARARYDVALAESVQRTLMPALPSLPPWALSAHYQPAEGGRIGGDWFDALRVGPDHIAIVLGDVAGHGTDAAGVMAQLRNVLRAHLHAGADPARAATLLNGFMTDLLPDTVATLFVARLDDTTGRGEAVCLGHPRPHVLGAGGVRQIELPISRPLGTGATVYTASELALSPGERLVLFSDGLFERRHEDLDVSLQRLVDTLAGLGPDDGAPELVQRAEHDGRDDITALMVEWRPPTA